LAGPHAKDRITNYVFKQHAIAMNPQGPATGTLKVVRSGGVADSPLIGSTVHRYKEDPHPLEKDAATGAQVLIPSSYMSALRCAVSPR
jgi:hypothetical protein